jgi:hypothetical protein
MIFHLRFIYDQMNEEIECVESPFEWMEAPVE